MLGGHCGGQEGVIPICQGSLTYPTVLHRPQLVDPTLAVTTPASSAVDALEGTFPMILRAASRAIQGNWVGQVEWEVGAGKRQHPRGGLPW